MNDIPDVTITSSSVLFNGKEIPWPIAEGGMTVIPGGADAANKLVIEFIVGNISITADYTTRGIS